MGKLSRINDFGFDSIGAGILPDFGTFQADLMEFGVMGLSAVGGTIAWNSLVAPLIPAVGSGNFGRALTPVLEITAGVLAGTYLMKMDRRVGIGVAVGLSADGLKNLVGIFMPNLFQGAAMETAVQEAAVESAKVNGIFAGLGRFSPNMLLNGAVVDVESLNGAVVDVQTQSDNPAFNGLGYGVGQPVASTLY